MDDPAPPTAVSWEGLCRDYPATFGGQVSNGFYRDKWAALYREKLKNFGRPPSLQHANRWARPVELAARLLAYGVGSDAVRECVYRPEQNRDFIYGIFSRGNGQSADALLHLFAPTTPAAGESLLANLRANAAKICEELTDTTPAPEPNATYYDACAADKSVKWPKPEQIEAAIGEQPDPAFTLPDRFPLTPAGHVAFIESVRDEIHHAAEGKRNQFARNYSNDTLESMVRGRSERCAEARRRLATLTDIPVTVRNEVDAVLARELTIRTVERFDELLGPVVQRLRDTWEDSRAGVYPAALDDIMDQVPTAAADSELKPATGLTPVALQQLAVDVRSLAANLHCCIQDLNDEQSALIMQRVHEQLLRIQALLPKQLALADCDLFARGTLRQLAAWVEVVEPQLKNASPPFQIPELGRVYEFASAFDRHADADARRKAVAPPFTELQRQQLQQKYGATEYLRRRWADEPDDAVERIDAGMSETLRRFPDTRSWTADDWSLLFICDTDVVRHTATWRSLDIPAITRPNTSKSQTMDTKSDDPQPPKVFISYSWDSDGHKSWIKQLATRLRGDGLDVTLDQWSVVPGDQLPKFMETAIRENSYVLIVCTPNYKLKSDQRKGGVGYEGDIMTAEVLTERNDRKFIAVLRSGSWDAAMPSWLKGKYSIDLSGDAYFAEQYSDLLVTLHNKREQAPPIGKTPHFGSIGKQAKTLNKSCESTDAPFEPIKIEGVLTDEAGRPTNDGTHGSALYSVPFKLNRVPIQEWSDLFVQTWDHPPRFTTSHRPGIARVQGDRIILHRTTIEEVKDVHRDTLKLVVDAVNGQIEELVRTRRAAEQAKQRGEQQHRDNIRKVADDINFD